MRQVALFLFINLLLIPFCPKIIYSATYTIFMHDGGTVEASHYVIEGDNLKVFLQTPRDAIVVFPRAYVDKVIKNKEEETNKVSNKNEKKRGELCDAKNIRCDQYYCCHELDIMQAEMGSVCEGDPRNDREVIKNNCIRHKKKMARMEENCPNCYVVKMCCR